MEEQEIQEFPPKYPGRQFVDYVPFEHKQRIESTNNGKPFCVVLVWKGAYLHYKWPEKGIAYYQLWPNTKVVDTYCEGEMAEEVMKAGELVKKLTEDLSGLSPLSAPSIDLVVTHK